MQIKSEWQLLAAIKDIIDKKGIKNPQDLVIGIGDDCASFRLDSKRFGLISTDISVESIHFRRDLISPEDIGFKAMMSNLSDIAAMGGSPRFAFISIGIPSDFSQEETLEIYEGLVDAANMAETAIAGGDISKSKGLILNIAIYGETTEDRIIRRDGAGIGDTIYVTGSPGDSKAGLEILLFRDDSNLEAFQILIQKHKRPIARFGIKDEIINVFNPTSMIDISDGLLSDIKHICNRSSVGFKIYEEKLPVSEELYEFTAIYKKNPYEYSLTSGEEYELLFTASKSLADMMTMRINDVPITPIGEIVDRGSYIARHNQLDEVSIAGFDHFNDDVSYE